MATVSLTSNFYVYIHYRKSDDLPFYIGKGAGYRYLQKTSRNPYWHNTANKHGYYSKFIKINMPEADAHKLESRLIALYRKRLKTLTNITEGGDGISGYVHTAETKKKLSELKKGKPNPCSILRAQQISKAKAGKPTKTSKSVFCESTGEVFKTVGEASRAHNCNKSNLAKHLKRYGSYKTIKGKIYKWLESV